MAYIDWPSTPFYIQNNVGRNRSDLRATAKIEEGATQLGLALEAVPPQAATLWIASLVGRRDGKQVACLLPCGIDKASGTSVDAAVQYALSCTISPSGAASDLTIAPISAVEAGQWFVLVGEEDHTTLQIKPAIDEGMCLACWFLDQGAFGVGLYNSNNADDQYWSIIHDEGTLTALDLSFDLPSGQFPKGQVLSGDGSSVFIDNRQGLDSIVVDVELEYVDSETNKDTFSSTKTTATTVTASVGLTGTISKALSINLGGSVSQTDTESTTFGSEKTIQETQTYRQRLSVTVARGQYAAYSLRANIGVLPVVQATVQAVMYTAIPGAEPFAVTLPGTYTGKRLLQLQIIGSAGPSPMDEDPPMAPTFPRSAMVNHMAVIRTQGGQPPAIGT